MKRNPKDKQIIQRVRQRKPKNTAELLDVEKSQMTGAKPTSNSAVMAIAESRIAASV